MEWIYSVAVLASSIAAVLAWAAKILWSKEYKEATDRLIQAKDAELAAFKTHTELVRDFTSDKLQQILRATREVLEEEVERLRQEIVEKDEEVARLRAAGGEAADKIRELNKQRVKDEGGIVQLQNAIVTIGKTVNYYVDVRRLMNDPVKSRRIESRFAKTLKSSVKKSDINKICVVDEDSVTRRLLIGNSLAQTIESPPITVSRAGELSGEVKAGDKVLFVDDVLSSGVTLRRVMKVLEARGAKVAAALVLCDARRARPEVVIGKPIVPIQSVLALSDVPIRKEVSEPSVPDDA